MLLLLLTVSAAGSPFTNPARYFVQKKITEDPLWKSLKVTFSGHEVRKLRWNESQRC